MQDIGQHLRYLVSTVREEAMEIKLTQTENKQTFDVAMSGSNLNGVISNNTSSGLFEYKPDEFEGYLTSKDLLAVAVELDRLNSAKP